MRLFLGLILALMVMSCGHTSSSSFYYVGNSSYSHAPAREIKIYVDKNFGEGDRTAIDDALKQWNFALNGYEVLTVESYSYDMEIDVLKQAARGEAWLFLKINHDNSFIPDAGPGHSTLAFVNKIGGSIIYFVRDRMYNEWVTSITLHEIGHLLGAQHEPKTLMQATYDVDTYRCVDRDTLEQVATYEHLNFNNLKYCKWGEEP